MTFDIRNHLDKLTPTNTKGKYFCPVCNGKNLGIQAKTGKYKCWSNECDNALIRNAIAPVDATVTDYATKPKAPPRPKAKPVTIATAPTFDLLEDDRTYPKKEKVKTPKWAKEDIKQAECIQTVYHYGDGNAVVRLDHDGGKVPRPFCEGKLGKGDRPWEAYRINEVLDYCANGKFIFAVEGEKTTEANRYLGFPTITWQGGSWTESDISVTVITLKSAGCGGLIFIPDHDDPGSKKADKVAEVCASHSFPCLIVNPLHIYKEIPHGGDVADFVVYGKSLGDTAESMRMDILRAVSRAFEDQKPEQPDPAKTEPTKPAPPVTAETTRPLDPHIPETRRIHGGYKDLKIPELNELISDAMGDRLKFDDLRSEVLLDDKVFSFDAALRLWFYHEFKETAPKEDIYATMLYHAKHHSFNPVENYLNQVQATATRVSLDNLSQRYFGTTDPIYDRMVKMWLISAIARVLIPGCQVDHTLILQSSQGKYKSTFFKVLAGDWFDDSVRDLEKPDTMLTLHSSWIVELAELDRITSKKQAGIVKHFLTKRSDTFRKPYGKEVERYERRSVFCGTVNPSRFLVDDENRRFWIVPVSDALEAIDIPLLERERDGIWAAAVDALLSGEKWYPTDEEKARISALNRDFRDMDVWAEPIEDYISDRPFVSTYEILTDLFKMGTGEIQRRDQMRVSKVLDMLGWTKDTRRMVYGKYRNVRLNPNHVAIEENSLFDGATPINNPNINSKVSMVGISPTVQGFESIPTSYQPAPEVGMQQGRYIPTSENGVGITGTPAQQGLYQPTDLDVPIPEKYSRAGFRFAVGEKVYRKNTSFILTITGFPAVGGDFADKRYSVIDHLGQPAKVPQSHMVAIDPKKR